MDEAAAACWRAAATIDSSVRLPARLAPRVADLQVRPERYSRHRLFSAMARQEIVLFHDFPLRGSMKAYFLDGREPTSALKKMFGPRATTMVKSGPAQRVRWLRVRDVVDAWWLGRRVLSANDVFYRELGLDRTFDCEAIGDFSVLRHAPRRIRDIEVATLLMGTRGCMSDSHSDDPDGCNHCVMGRKFWLAWDRREGQAAGLQDCEYDDVYTRARFDVATFSRLASARWFTVSEGTTLFLPGNFTHKVITLQRYLGISNFYVALPNALSSLTRWRLHGAHMVTEAIWSHVLELVADRLRSTMEGPRADRHFWGFYHVGDALSQWRRRYSADERDRMCGLPPFRALHELMTRCSR
jgi:hypothetical protein